LTLAANCESLKDARFFLKKHACRPLALAR
jgi:hypothetical protein